MDLTHDLVLVRPNVRAKRATTVARQARAVENATAPRPGPGELPLALRLSEGLGGALNEAPGGRGVQKVPSKLHVTTRSARINLARAVERQ